MGIGTIKTGIRKILPWAVGGIGLVQQTTHSDVDFARTNGYWDGNTSLGSKLANVGYWFVSRLTNGNTPTTTIGGKTIGPVKPTIQLGNTLNKWTGLGAVLVTYGGISKLMGRRGRGVLPESRTAWHTGLAALVAGIGGGLLDNADSYSAPAVYSPGAYSSQLNRAGAGSINRSIMPAAGSSGLNSR